ncbi:MAG: carbohydrate ABC transporter permease [Herpetosiphon sp.]
MAASATIPSSAAVKVERTNRTPRAIVARAGFWFLIGLILLYTIFPFYWAIVSSLKPSAELFDTPVAYWPKHLTFDNYIAVFENSEFRKTLFNSLIVAGSSVLLSLAIGAIGSYALGRLQFRGKNVMLYTILAMTMFPAIAVLGSLYQMIRTFHLYNTYAALILTYLTFSLPFTVWVLANFFKGMPAELEQAALVDGATPFQTFYLVLLPLAAPGLVTTGLLAFISAWNEFLFALTFTIDTKARTVPVTIAQFGGKSSFELPWGSIMAASVTVTVPLILMVLFFQRRIMAGLTAGAVKG